MADTDTDTTTAPAPATASPDLLAQAMQLAKQFMPQQVQQDTTPVQRSWTSLLGQALAGGAPVAGMSDADKETAGSHALMDFGTGLMAASRYQPGQTLFSNLAGGFQGAKQGEIGAEEMAMARLGAQQEYAQQQGQNKLEALKTALPFLQLQARQGLPSPFAQGAGGPPAPNVAQGGSISAGAGGAAPALTGDLEKDRQIIAQRESGGDPTKLNYVALADPTAYARGATASGKYQFVNSTWQDGLKLAGLDPSKYPTAMSAPESVQDQVFTAVYKRDGTKPWDASTFKQNWVPTPTGQMILANVVPGGKSGATTPPTTAPATPAPYKVATTGPIPPPPSGAPTAPATTDLPVPPIPPTTTPPAAPSPQQTSQADQPPAQLPVTTPPAAPPLDIKSAPDTTLNPEQYVLKHWTPLSPEEVARYAPGPENQLAVDRSRQVQQAQADATAARQTYLNVQSGRVPGDLNKSLSDMNTADARADAAEKDYNTAVQGLQTSGAKNLLEADNQQRQQLRADFKSIVTDPAAAAALKTQEGEQAIALAKVNAGYTAQQHQQDTEQKVGSTQLDGMNTAAQKAEAIQPMLRELIPLMKTAPSGLTGQILQAHPEWIPTLTNLGLDPKTATITQLISGLTDYLSLDLKPSATGAMRVMEIPMLKGLMPQLGQSTQAQQQALARILNYTQRVKNEADFANENFGAVDPKTNQPNYKILYKNIDAPMELDENGTRIGGGLGPVVPEAPAPVANPNPGQLEAARRYQKYVANLPSGMPYNTYERQADGSLQRVLKIHD